MKLTSVLSVFLAILVITNTVSAHRGDCKRGYEDCKKTVQVN